MKLKGVIKAIAVCEQIMTDICNQLDELDGSETKYERLNDAYMSVDAAIESLKEIEQL